MTTPKHEYPSKYGPGKPGAHPAVEEAWAILDTVKPGVIPLDVRSWLAGLITGALIRTAKDPDSMRPKEDKNAS